MTSVRRLNKEGFLSLVIVRITMLVSNALFATWNLKGTLEAQIGFWL